MVTITQIVPTEPSGVESIRAWRNPDVWEPSPGSSLTASIAFGPVFEAASIVEKPSLFAAVPEQLGLKLELHPGPVQVFVIDRAERPAEN
jgi:hypothetical protein